VRTKIQSALDRANLEGTLRDGTDIPRLANFILAAFEGAFMMGKLHRDAEVMASVVDELKAHLVHYRVV
jgi:hypothetical protein